MHRKLLITALTSIIYATTFSQGILKGKVMDSSAKAPLGYATITVFKAVDTTILTYRLSTPEGDFKVPGLPLDVNCRVVISFSGFGIYRKEFILTSAKPQLDLGTINMPKDSRTLDEVLVFAERPPVVMKKDTIEFNASAFKTLPNALVEDLLKKLPGVQVDRDGNITVGGKAVNRILVDGKTFFGNDPKMATRNLPANVIDKVQVVDDLEELQRNGDDNLNNVGKVVNITLKKGVKKGWFGKLYAGKGSNDLYELGGIANIYRDTFQISVLGYANNMNKTGFSFSELMSAGGFDRVRSNSISNTTSSWNNGSGGSGISINGINFGGSQNFGGISTSKGAGFNINHAPNLKRSVYLQYFYGNVLAERRVRTNTEQFNADTIINNDNLLTGDMRTNGHNVGAGFKLKPDSVTTVIFNGSFLKGYQDEDRISTISSVNNKLGNLSSGLIDQDNLADLYIFRQSFSFTRLSKTKKGRRYSISNNTEVNNRYNDYSTESGIRFLYPTQIDSVSDQLRKERIPRTDANITANYSDPWTKKITWRLTARYEYSGLNNTVNTFNKSGSGFYDVKNPSLSSNFRRTNNRYMITSGFEFKVKQFTITPQIRGLMQNADNVFASNPNIRFEQTDILPALGITYKTVNFNYNKDVVLPSYTNLLPVRDNTNPYFITRGNPDLQPLERHNFSLNYNFNDPKKYLNAGVYGNGSIINNDVIQSITVDEKGVQTSVPVNVNGTKNFYMNYNIYKQYKQNPKFIYSWSTGSNFNYNSFRLMYNNVSSWQQSVNYNFWVGMNLNLNDKFEYNTSFSYGKNFTRYTNPVFTNRDIGFKWWDNELILRWPKHIIWETQLSYSYNSNIPVGLPKDVVRWHAAVNITMLKDERGVLKIAVFDILDQNNGIGTWVQRNQVTTTNSNILTRYVMATFSYNVRAAGVKKRIGGRDRLFMF